MPCGQPRPASPVLLLVLALAAGGAACQPGAPAATRTGLVPIAESSSPVPSAPASDREHPALPAGFPVLAGARAQALPEDDPSLIARWTSDEVGPVAYDFYVEALPAAGYPTTGLFPGGAVAVIRFDGPDAAAWQLVLTQDGAGTRIEVRLDQP